MSGFYVQFCQLNVMLTENWLIEGLSDYEYKKYLFLAFMQKQGKELKDKRLYPALTELIAQHQYMSSLKAMKEKLQADFPKKITGIDHEKLALIFESTEHDSLELETIQAIIDFALPKVEHEIRVGKDIYLDTENKLTIEPIGIMPIQKTEGFLFIKPVGDRVVQLYQYQLSAIQLAGEAFKGIYLNYLDTFVKRVSETFESLKLQLIKEHQIKIVPATYLVEYTALYPYNETILPIAKRKMMGYLSTH